MREIVGYITTEDKKLEPLKLNFLKDIPDLDDFNDLKQDLNFKVERKNKLLKSRLIGYSKEVMKKVNYDMMVDCRYKQTIQ